MECHWWVFLITAELYIIIFTHYVVRFRQRWSVPAEMITTPQWSQSNTLPKTNSKNPWKMGLGNYFPFGKAYSQGIYVSFKEGITGEFFQTENPWPGSQNP